MLLCYNSVMRKIKICFSIVILMVLCCAVYAQNATIVSEMIESPAVTVHQVAYLLSVYTGVADESASVEEALAASIESGLCRKSAKGDSPVDYTTLAGICMRAFGFRGGLMYTITHADHYALRELQSMGLLASTVVPQAKVDGFSALLLINDCLAAAEAK